MASGRPSVFSRFRLVGAAVMIGIGLVGAISFGLINSHYLGLILGRTLGPYSDTLARAGFESEDPDLWRQIAQRHGVAILFEARPGEAVAWDETGASITPRDLVERRNAVRALRTAADGRRVTLYWNSNLLPAHLRALGALGLLTIAVVGGAFWYMDRQLRPLARLQLGVDAVAGGNFDTRVPIVRNDEIGRVAVSFNDMAARVGEMMEGRERLLADVSHELRSPISRIKVALELMPEGDKRDAVARDLREMEALIRALLDREALAARTGRLQAESVELTRVARAVAATFADREPGVEVHADEELAIEADPMLVRVLLQNLIDNAVKFSKEGSRPVVITLARDGAGVRLSVQDDGIGVPAGEEQRLFEPFTKLDRARGHHAGHGLGLNLCQRIVQLHGGRIELAGRDSGGTEVLVRLPTVAAARPS